MKEIIRGDIDRLERIAAKNAIKAHRDKYGLGMMGKYVIYNIKCGDKLHGIEVVTRKSSYVANVMNHHRRLSKIVNLGR